MQQSWPSYPKQTDCNGDGIMHDVQTGFPDDDARGDLVTGIPCDCMHGPNTRKRPQIDMRKPDLRTASRLHVVGAVIFLSHGVRATMHVTVTLTYLSRFQQASTPESKETFVLSLCHR